MPNFVERLFRAIFLYTGLFWAITGLWGIPQGYFSWDTMEHNGMRFGDNPIFSTIFFLFFGIKLIAGILLTLQFKNVAHWQYRHIPNLTETDEPKWHDTTVFATLLAVVTGLYCINITLSQVWQYLLQPLAVLAQGFWPGTFSEFIDYYWQPIFIPFFCLAFGAVLLVYSGKIAGQITRMVEQTQEIEETEELKEAEETEVANAGGGTHDET